MEHRSDKKRERERKKCEKREAKERLRLERKQQRQDPAIAEPQSVLNAAQDVVEEDGYGNRTGT